jgi:hypothetical protein
MLTCKQVWLKPVSRAVQRGYILPKFFLDVCQIEKIINKIEKIEYV